MPSRFDSHRQIRTPTTAPAAPACLKRSDEIPAEPQLVGEVKIEGRLEPRAIGETEQEGRDEQQLPRPDLRAHFTDDGGQVLARRALLELTRQAEAVLRALTLVHRRELRVLAPRLIALLRDLEADPSG